MLNRISENIIVGEKSADLKISNLTQRILVAIFGIPLIVCCLYFGSYALLFLVLIINALSQYEFYNLAKRKDTYPVKTVGIMIGLLIPIVIFLKGPESIWWILTGGSLIILFIELFRKKENATLNVAITILGVIYPTFFFDFVILIREIPKNADIPYRHGGIWLIVIIMAVWICDTAAYFIGKTTGKRKLFYRISPNKTWEGAIAGFIASIVTVSIAYLLFPEVLSLIHYLVIGIIVGVFSQVGDLVESFFKRDAGIKDSSAILPGHGGVLDRFDSPIFLAPIIYFYFIVFVF